MTINTMRNLVSLKHLLPPTHNHSWKNNYVVRLLHTSNPIFAREITKKVKSYGILSIELPCNVQVKSIDPHLFPNMDTLLVNIHSDNSQNVDIEQFIKIHTNQSISTINAQNHDNFNFPNDATFVFQTPIQYDVDVKVCGDSGISISNMVSGSISAETEKGNITGSKLQSNKMKFISKQGGSIKLTKSLQGDIEARTTADGSIEAEKCLGTSLRMGTENGDINLGSNYCYEAFFSTVDGNLSLNNLHMEAAVEIKGKGSLSVSCLDGSLQAKIKDGDTKINVTRLTGQSRVVSEGLVDLVVPRENNIELNLQSHELSLDENLRGTETSSGDVQSLKTPGEIPLHVETPGNLRIKSLSWAESFQLGKFAK